jgi:hypothetical protein
MEKHMAEAARADNQNEAAGAKRPADTARHGNVEIAIWRDTSSKGDFYSASAPTIRYKADAGDWKDGTNFGRHDLLDLADSR